ncbi:hypothetical protein BH10PLA2_BH10PLA2_26000 [soil metagenome]
MTEPERSDLLKVFAELAQKYPQWRVGQLVANVAGWADVEVWDAEDEQLLSAARAHLASSAPADAKAGFNHATEQVAGK